MLNQVNLNTNNTFTEAVRDVNNTNNNPQSNLLSVSNSNTDTFEMQQEKDINSKKPIPTWAKVLGATLITTAAVFGVGFLTTKLGYTPLKTNTKGLFNSRTTEFKNGAKDAIGGIQSVMTMNSHCDKKSLEKLPSSHQGLIVIMDKQEEKGIKTFAQSKFKDNIIYGGELKLTQLHDYDNVKKYVNGIAQKINNQENHENITFASENSRIANMLNVVLKCHAEGKKATTYDFVDGGIPSHNFWGKNGIDSNKLDEAIWDGWCQGMKIKSSPTQKGNENETPPPVTENPPPVAENPPPVAENPPHVPTPHVQTPHVQKKGTPPPVAEEEKTLGCLDKAKEYWDAAKEIGYQIKEGWNNWIYIPVCNFFKMFNKSKK